MIATASKFIRLEIHALTNLGFWKNLCLLVVDPHPLRPGGLVEVGLSLRPSTVLKGHIQCPQHPRGQEAAVEVQMGKHTQGSIAERDHLASKMPWLNDHLWCKNCIRINDKLLWYLGSNYCVESGFFVCFGFENGILRFLGSPGPLLFLSLHFISVFAGSNRFVKDAATKCLCEWKLEVFELKKIIIHVSVWACQDLVTHYKSMYDCQSVAGEVPFSSQNSEYIICSYRFNANCQLWVC